MPPLERERRNLRFRRDWCADVALTDPDAMNSSLFSKSLQVRDALTGSSSGYPPFPRSVTGSTQVFGTC